MSGLFADGRIADLILLFTALEWGILSAMHRRTGGSLAPTDLAVALLPGLLLILALRCALVQAWWGWTALCLAVSLPAHLADLRRRAR